MRGLTKLTAAGALASALAFALPAVAAADDHRDRRGGKHKNDDRIVFDITVGDLYGHDRRGRGHRARSGRDYHAPGFVPRRAVRRSLRHRGFYDIYGIELRPRRGVYVAHATGRRGAPVLVRLDAYSGQVLSVERKRPRRRARGGYGYGYHAGW